MESIQIKANTTLVGDNVDLNEVIISALDFAGLKRLLSSTKAFNKEIEVMLPELVKKLELRPHETVDLLKLVPSFKSKLQQLIVTIAENMLLFSSDLDLLKNILHLHLIDEYSL